MELKLKKQRDQKEHSRETNKAPRSVLKHKKGESKKNRTVYPRQKAWL